MPKPILDIIYDSYVVKSGKYLYFTLELHYQKLKINNEILIKKFIKNMEQDPLLYHPYL